MSADTTITGRLLEASKGLPKIRAWSTHCQAEAHEPQITAFVDSPLWSAEKKLTAWSSRFGGQISKSQTPMHIELALEFLYAGELVRIAAWFRKSDGRTAPALLAFEAKQQAAASV